MKPRAVLACAVLATACNGGLTDQLASPTTPGTVEELLTESQNLGGLLSFETLVFVALVVGVTFAASRGLDLLLKFLWRIGLDGNRRLARPTGLLRLALVAGALLFLAKVTWKQLPLLTSAFLLAALLGALFSTGYLANVAAGISLMLRKRLQVGDRVVIGEHQGIVRELQLTKLQLRSSSGSTILLPTSLVNSQAIDIDRARNTVPIQLVVDVTRPNRALLANLRTSLLLSPYRAPGSAVVIVADPHDATRYTLGIQVWSARVSQQARAQILASVERALAQAE